MRLSAWYKLVLLVNILLTLLLLNNTNPWFATRAGFDEYMWVRWVVAGILLVRCAGDLSNAFAVQLVGSRHRFKVDVLSEAVQGYLASLGSDTIKEEARWNNLARLW